MEQMVVIKKQIDSVIEDLYANEQYKLRQMCNKEMSKFGGISQKDHDDFYSRAGYELSLAKKSYDPSKGKTFMEYASGVIKRSIWKEMTDRNRAKRQIIVQKDEMDECGNIITKKEYIPTISIDAPIGDEKDLTIGDTLQSDFNIDTVLFENIEGFRDERVNEYLNSLTMIQRQIINMKMKNMSVSEIKEKLGLSDKEYGNQFCQIKSFKNIKNFRSIFSDACNCIMKEEEETFMTTQITQTAEKSKPMQYSISSINKKIENYTIRFDHPLQRESDQWNPSMKGNLVSDILQGNPLPEIVFAEQIINGIPVVWDLDGKQRCTNCYSFANDGFKVSKKIRRWNIKYLAQVKDENGNPVLDENGFPTSKYKECDIRNKKFSQLPKELQEKFLDYTFKCEQYLNCDSEDIAYHIIRYNEGKNMNKAQKGITRIGEEFAALVKSISAMPFFREKGGYKVSEAKNGTLERVVVESIMASKYLSEWKKEQELICEYLKDNASVEDFYDFEDMVTRLEAVAMNDEVSDMFNSKDSFLWFGLFARFNNTGKDDEKFIEFMAEFSRSLHNKALDGITYDELCVDQETGKTRATKDKYIILPKIELLEKLMLEYLNIDKQDTKELDILEFVRENVSLDITQEDVELYEEVLDDLMINVDNSSKLANEENKPSLIAMVANSFKNDIDLDNWIISFFKNNNTYEKDQKKNYLYMKANLEQFIYIQNKKSA